MKSNDNYKNNNNNINNNKRTTIAIIIITIREVQKQQYLSLRWPNINTVFIFQLLNIDEYFHIMRKSCNLLKIYLSWKNPR